MGSNRGYALIGLLAVLFLLVIGLGAVTLFELQTATGQRESHTKDTLNKLKLAIVGNPTIITNDVRVSFGYLGSMGGFPPHIEDLWIKGDQPVYAYDTTYKIGAGWIGPYCDIGTVTNAFQYDQWGNSLAYNTTEYTRADGALVSAAITSPGPDQAVGTSDDLYVEILKNEAFATVSGYAKNSGGAAAQNIQVTLNLPQNGAISKRYATTDANGYYSFPNVPFGVRSVTVDPKLIYADGSASLKGGSKEDLSFTISNFGANDVSITSMALAYSPAAYYEKVSVGGTVVFNSTSPRQGSGYVINFSPKTVRGTGKVYPPTVFLAQVPVVTVDNVVVGSVGQGTSLNISVDNFTNVPTGSGSFVNMSGVAFTVTFSDGSVVTFTTPP